MSSGRIVRQLVVSKTFYLKAIQQFAMEKHNFYQENHAATAIDTIVIAIAMKPIESHPSRLPGELLHGSFFGVELEKYDIAERRCDNATFKIGRHF